MQPLTVQLITVYHLSSWNKLLLVDGEHPANPLMSGHVISLWLIQVSQYTFAMCSYREKKAEPVELLQLDGYTVDYTDPQPGKSDCMLSHDMRWVCVSIRDSNSLPLHILKWNCCLHPHWQIREPLKTRGWFLVSRIQKSEGVWFFLFLAVQTGYHIVRQYVCTLSMVER